MYVRRRFSGVLSKTDHPPALLVPHSTVVPTWRNDVHLRPAMSIWIYDALAHANPVYSTVQTLMPDIDVQALQQRRCPWARLNELDGTPTT